MEEVIINWETWKESSESSNSLVDGMQKHWKPGPLFRSLVMIPKIDGLNWDFPSLLVWLSACLSGDELLVREDPGPTEVSDGPSNRGLQPRLVRGEEEKSWNVSGQKFFDGKTWV